MSESELVLLGDEAIALGAIHAGISAAYAYPGTPSTEITEYILEYSKENGTPFASWASNEKTAYEQALGVSFVGKRALVCMKHVGLNVAADPFVNSALLEIHGGLVLVVADDPGMHSSQNEQDSRFYADFAGVPCLEPINQQEAYHMMREAFDLSEEFHVPVVVRITTRLAHSRAVITPVTPKSENKLDKAGDTSKWMLLPALARKQFKCLLEKQTKLKRFSEETKYNTLEINPEFREYGVITTGLGRNYYVENIGELTPVARLRRYRHEAYQDGLVEEPQGEQITLTDAGLAAAARVTRNHRLWELYLIEYADVATSRVDRDADAVEHVLGERLVAQLEAKLRQLHAAGGVAVPASPHPIRPGD